MVTYVVSDNSSCVVRRGKNEFMYHYNEQISQNPRRVAHCRVSSLVMVCKSSFAAKANLLAIETALLTRRQQSADHKDKVCHVGVTG